MILNFELDIPFPSNSTKFRDKYFYDGLKKRKISLFDAFDTKLGEVVIEDLKNRTCDLEFAMSQENLSDVSNAIVLLEHHNYRLVFTGFSPSQLVHAVISVK